MVSCSTPIQLEDIAPCKTTLDKYLGTAEYGTGVSELAQLRLKAEAECLDDEDRVVSIAIDEMSLKERLIYERSTGKYHGLVDAEGVYENQIGDNMILANKLLCMVMHGLRKHFTIPVSYYFVRSLKGKEQHGLAVQTINVVESLGFRVIRVVVDNAKQNVMMFKLFSPRNELNITVPHPSRKDDPLFLSFDQNHALKNAKTQFLERSMSDTDGEINPNLLHDIHRMQKKWPVKPVRFLTKRHLMPSNPEKMSVLPAVQIFSQPLIAVVKYLQIHSGRFATKEDFNQAAPTIRFMEHLHRFFAVHDIRNTTQHIRQNLPDKKPFYDVDDERLEWLLKDFPNFLDNIQVQSHARGLQGLTNETLDALIFTSQSTAVVVKYLLQTTHKFVCTADLNSDPVESTFSVIRIGGGCNDTTDVRAAISGIRKILATGYLLSARYANVAARVRFQSRVSIGSSTTCASQQMKNQELVLPIEITSILDKLQNPPDNITVTLQSAGQAWFTGYLVDLIEEHMQCEECLDGIGQPKTSSPLHDLIYLQDRGGLHYPTPQFVYCERVIEYFLQRALPHCSKGINLTAQLTKVIQPKLMNSSIFRCPQDGHKRKATAIIIKKLLSPVLSNIGSNRTNEATENAWQPSHKTLSRKSSKY
ncbi:hypothetical protein B566_EDAN014875 [Ephemera danica]|nr:hypothetical protein B566_EDAN014875 [Ephemera danica]